MRCLLISLYLCATACASCHQRDAAAPVARSDQETALADCLTRKGVKLYSAKWCGACRKQEDMFGAAADSLPIVDCTDTSKPGCATERGWCFPTWSFPDGRRECGVLDLGELARKADCPWNP